MGKRRAFEDILNTPLRWPAPEDRPFVIADNPFDNAKIADDGFTRLLLMIEGYKSAADLMVQAATAEHSKRDVLVFPIIFNYRQFLELSLKCQIATYGPFVGVEANWRSHDLAELWGLFLKILDLYGTDDPDEADPAVGAIILEFAKIDPRSYSYRYPVHRDGTPLPIAQSDLHLPTLADVMRGVAGYFSGCNAYLSARFDAGP